MRVVIAEDNALLREGLVLLLTSAGHQVVAVAGAGPEILPALEAHRPDVAVLDVRMPPGFRDEGLRAALAARREIPGLPVLVLSQYVEASYAAELLGGGASGVGYLLKDRVGRVEEFLDALDRVAAGGTALDPEVVTELFARRGSPLDALTPREREVLTLMAEGHDNAAIAAALVITERAVHKHIGNVFAKLGLPSTDSGHRRVLAVLAYLQNSLFRTNVVPRPASRTRYSGLKRTPAFQWPNSPGPSWSAYRSNAASIASASPAPATCQSRLARETRLTNRAAMIRGRGSVSGSTPSRSASTRTRVSAPSWKCRRCAASSVGVDSISLSTDRYAGLVVTVSRSAVTRRSDSRKASRSAVSGSSPGGRAVSAVSSASDPSWTNDSVRSSLLAKYRKNVRSETSTRSVISRTAVCSYP
jgi:DNA-binding NarL/FixJ family response regulator